MKHNEFVPVAETNKKQICSLCKLLQVRLVPTKDKDQKHKGKMICVTCKRKKKKNSAWMDK